MNIMHTARDYEVRIFFSRAAGDDCFVAQAIDWPGITAVGESREEAAREIQIALECALDFALESNIEPPLPRSLAVAAA